MNKTPSEEATGEHARARLQDPLLGILCKMAATAAFALLAVCIKWLGLRFPVGQVIFYRSFFALWPILAMALLTTRDFSLLRTNRVDAHAIRSFAGVVAMFLGFSALTLLPLADVTAISFASPLFVVVLAALILGEHVHAFRWSAVAVGFLGVIVMIGPHMHIVGGATTRGALYALAAAGCSAFAMVFLRRMSAHEHSVTIAFYFSLASAVIGLATLALGWADQNLADTAVLVLTGLLGGVGQLFLSYSYRYAEASLVATFDYLAMVWAILLGYFIFSEVPTVSVLAGASIVIVAGLLIAWREHRLGRASVPRKLTPL